MRGTWGAGRGGEVTLGHCFHPVKHLYADIAYGWLPAQDYVPLMANAAGLAIRLLALGSPPGHGNEQLDRPHPRRKKVRHSDNNGINNIIICDLFCPLHPPPPTPRPLFPPFSLSRLLCMTHCVYDVRVRNCLIPFHQTAAL